MSIQAWLQVTVAFFLFSLKTVPYWFYFCYFVDSKTSKDVQDSTAFGPHLLVNSEAQQIAQAGEAFLQASSTASKR